MLDSQRQIRGSHPGRRRHSALSSPGNARSTKFDRLRQNDLANETEIKTKKKKKKNSAADGCAREAGQVGDGEADLANWKGVMNL